MKILVNKAKCRLCGQILESINDNTEYNYCKCESIAVSGGRIAILRIGHHNNIIEMSEKEY